MLLTQMMLFHNMVQILFVYMKCSWVHSGFVPFPTYPLSDIFIFLSVIYLTINPLFYFPFNFSFHSNLHSSFTFRDSKTWSTSGIDGVHRFLARVWRLVVGSPSVDGKFNVGTVDLDGEPSLEQLRSLHRCISKVIISISFALQKKN